MNITKLLCCMIIFVGSQLSAFASSRIDGALFIVVNLIDSDQIMITDYA